MKATDQHSEPRPADALMDAVEAAAYVGVHAQTFRKWVRSGKVGYTELPSGVRRYSRAQIDASMRRVPAEARPAA
jgi:excisionase family DNA binding protein